MFIVLLKKDLFKLYFFLKGFYAKGIGANSCSVCPAGFQCIGSPVSPQSCPKGYYCLEGNSSSTVQGRSQVCPLGTYGASKNLKKPTECLPCPPGKYCDGSVIGNYTGLCNAGFWCKLGAISPNPSAQECPDGNCQFGPCPKGGYFCPQGSSSYQPCPPGHFVLKDDYMLKSVDQCIKCTSGYYCSVGNQTIPTGPCSPGYFCLEGSYVSKPRNSSYGGICPSGTFCRERSNKTEPCKPGTYNDKEGMSECKGCPPGFYCPSGSKSPLECPKGYWCEENSTSAFVNACPIGTFNKLTQRYLKQHCISCTPGHYCDTPGN